jgi:hypothetical protein
MVCFVVVAALSLGTLVPPGTSEVRPELASSASYLCSFYFTVVLCSVVDLWVAYLTLILGNCDGVLLWVGFSPSVHWYQMVPVRFGARLVICVACLSLCTELLG